MNLLFIADLHLAEERPAITRAFFDFLDNQARQADTLYILGDLMEAWIGDDDPGELASSVKSALRALSDSGTDVCFLHGNRDFLVGKRFAADTGCTLLPDYHLLEYGGQRILVCHGDTLCLGDAAYQKFRRKVRNPVYRWLLAHLPLKKRQRIAREWRAKSLAANNNKADNIMDVTPAEVERVLQEYNASVLIHGHTHRPGVHSHTNGERIVLGDWHHKGWYIAIDGDAIRLVDFDITDSEPESPAPAIQAEAEHRCEAELAIPEPAPAPDQPEPTPDPESESDEKAPDPAPLSTDTSEEKETKTNKNNQLKLDF